MEDKICGNYTLGLDIGIASVGAALLLKNQILGLHVRTFEKAETGEGESLNKARREARLVRRCLAAAGFANADLIKADEKRRACPAEQQGIFCRNDERIVQPLATAC